jgi:hypothetical protein
VCLRLTTLALLVSIAVSTPALAQRDRQYKPPRTEHQHPDLQGVWATQIITPLERPAGVEHLIASPDQARALTATIRGQLPSLIDPDVIIWNNQLAVVRGEYRTSLIVLPENGILPFTHAGAELSASIVARNKHAFDDPEQRPLAERCLQNFGAPPILPSRGFSAHQILQTREYVVLLTEGPVGLRVVHLAGPPPPDSLRRDDGYSMGHWEGDTLVVHTTHLRAEDPGRSAFPRPFVLSRRSRITERMTRVSATELLYRFTVEDADLYRQPWTGEFSMTRHDGPIYEYACHEANYSMENMLRGGQAEAARTGGTKRNP